jgi:hypothetical protein
VPPVSTGNESRTLRLPNEIAGKRIAKPMRIPRRLKKKAARAKLMDQLATDRFLILGKESNSQTPCRVANHIIVPMGKVSRSSKMWIGSDITEQRRTMSEFSHATKPRPKSRCSRFAASLFPVP